MPPAFSPGELYGAVPELADVCNLDTEKLFGIFSENMGASEYLVLAERIGEVVDYEGFDRSRVGTRPSATIASELAIVPRCTQGW